MIDVAKKTEINDTSDVTGVSNLTVSFCVIAYNEEISLSSLFRDITNQNYPHDKVEVIFVDGMSTDYTRKLMEKFKSENPDFIRVAIKQNFKKIQSSGWNIAIKEAKQDVIIRIDAHSSVPPEFISKNIECLESGEYISGGRRPCRLENETSWSRTLLLAENSMFGSSIASYRRGTEKKYVKSMFHAAYRKEVFNNVGLFNENLGRTEDNEMHYRMRQGGYNFCYNSDIVSYQNVRSNFKKMLKQKYGNGYWIGLTVGVCPKCLSLYHFVPFAFVLGIIITTMLTIFKLPQLAIMMWTLYVIINVLMSMIAVMREKFSVVYLLLPLLFFMLHVSYGIGTLVGIIRMPKWKNKIDDSIVGEII